MSAVERRTRAVARAGAGRESLWTVFEVGAILAIIAGAYFGSAPAMIAAAAGFGITIGRGLAQPDRLYMEGFSDGIVYEAANRTVDSGVARQPGGGDRHADALRGGAPEDVRAAVDGALDLDRGEAAGAGRIHPDFDDLGGADPRLHGVDRQRGPSYPDGPRSSLGEGPRPGGLPTIPPARPSKGPVTVRRPRRRSKADGDAASS